MTEWIIHLLKSGNLPLALVTESEHALVKLHYYCDYSVLIIENRLESDPLKNQDVSKSTQEVWFVDSIQQHTINMEHDWFV